VPDLVDASLDLLIDGEHGIWHLANVGEVTWAELARNVAVRLGLEASRIRPCAQEALGLPARRPRYSPLVSRKASIMPQLDHALARYIEEAALARGLDQEQGKPSTLLEA
jgi:dTDP-4-dehydrorhamnose reductase